MCLSHCECSNHCLVGNNVYWVIFAGCNCQMTKLRQIKKYQILYAKCIFHSSYTVQQEAKNTKLLYPSNTYENVTNISALTDAVDGGQPIPDKLFVVMSRPKSKVYYCFIKLSGLSFTKIDTFIIIKICLIIAIIETNTAFYPHHLRLV